MTTNIDRESAKIYQFPPRGRFALSDTHPQFMPGGSVSQPFASKISYGSSWYHDEAIREADKVRKN